MAATPDLAGRESPGEGPLFEADFISQGHHPLCRAGDIYVSPAAHKNTVQCTHSISRGQTLLKTVSGSKHNQSLLRLTL